MLAYERSVLSAGKARQAPNGARSVGTLRSVASAQVTAPLAPSRLLAPVPGPTPFTAASRCPARAPSRGGRTALHVCAAGPKGADKDIDFDVTVSVEELSHCRRAATVTVPAKAVKEVFKRGVKRIERDVVGSLRGWQAGKPLPLSMVITQVGGQEKFKTYCLEELLLEALPKGVSAALNGRPVDPASVEVPAADIPAMLARYDPASDFTFTARFDVAPPVVWRTPLEALEVTIRDTGDYSTDAAAADDLIRQYRKQHGFSRVVAGRGLRAGDTLVMDMQIRSQASGQVLPNLDQKRISFDTDTDAMGLTQGMLGMRVGETRSFEMRMPADHEVEFWQNLPVVVTIKVHEIFEWTVPEFNDEYVAKHHGGQWTSAKEMREALIAATAVRRVELLDEQLGDAVIKAIAAALDMPEVPPRMVEQLGERQFQAQLLRMVQERVGGREDVEKLATEEMLAEFVAERRAELEDQVRFNLAVDDIFERAGLSLDEGAVQQEYALREAQMKAVGQPFDREELLGDVHETVKSVTVIEWLKDNVKRHVVPYSGAAAAPAAEAAAAEAEAAEAGQEEGQAQERQLVAA